ncbi:MAG: membrane protein insertase YidC [Solirubrobacterales bacterium]
MRYINDAFVQFFELIHKGVASVIVSPDWSYGISIILVTLIIRVILLPLSVKQTKSSIAMSELQPETKKLQEKYKNDPQKAQEELMKLYKEKGASPFSGCLPMLIQWPIFVALYYVFNTLTGINGVHFLWIRDLAKADIILAVLSGITTYSSGILMMPPSGDTAQSKQTQIMNASMAVFMVFISWKLRAALVLYWTVNNIVQILQTVVMKKMDLKKS